LRRVMIIAKTDICVGEALEETNCHLPEGTDKRHGNKIQDSPCSSRDLSPAPP